MKEIHDLSKQIDFNNLTYNYKSKIPSKDFIAFKGPLNFYNTIRKSYITLEKAEEEQQEFKNETNETVRGKNKTGGQIHAINNFKILYESRQKVIKLFDNFSRIVSEAKYKTKYGKGLKILFPKQMLRRLPIAFAQVKAGNTSENLLNKIRQIIYSLYRAKEINKIVYNNIMNSVKV